MSTVYVVSVGDYSDNQDIAAFTDKAKADEFAKVVCGYVEELPLDLEEALQVKGKTTFRVDSKVSDVEVASVSKEDPEYAIADAVGREVRRCCYRSDPYLSTRVLATDAEHAVKIAADRFRQFIAEKGWK